MFSLLLWTSVVSVFAISTFQQIHWEGVEPKKLQLVYAVVMLQETPEYFFFSPYIIPENPNKLFNYISSSDFARRTLLGENWTRQ